jgi:hypothetical protein
MSRIILWCNIKVSVAHLKVIYTTKQNEQKSNMKFIKIDFMNQLYDQNLHNHFLLQLDINHLPPRLYFL